MTLKQSFHHTRYNLASFLKGKKFKKLNSLNCNINRGKEQW